MSDVDSYKTVIQSLAEQSQKCKVHCLYLELNYNRPEHNIVLKISPVDHALQMVARSSCSSKSCEHQIHAWASKFYIV